MKPLHIAGAVLLIVAAVCLFVAYERYEANAASVAAMNQFGGGMMGLGTLTPATPAATKYALLFALLFGGGGAYCLWKAKSTPSA
jgi:hypothetical protein